MRFCVHGVEYEKNRIYLYSRGVLSCEDTKIEKCVVKFKEIGWSNQGKALLEIAVPLMLGWSY